MPSRPLNPRHPPRPRRTRLHRSPDNNPETPTVQQRVPAGCPPGFERYTVSQGDTLFGIAQRFGTTVDDLIAANPHIPNPSELFVGDVLCVPRTGEECPPGTDRYIVQPGDTMISIARQLRVSLEALIELNPQIENPNVLFPGDVLCVPGVGRPVLPCCIYLAIRELDIRGSALLEPFGALGQFSISVLVNDAPPPDEFGDFDAYIVEVIVPDIDVFKTGLSPVTNEPSLLAGRLIFSLPEGIIEFPTTSRIFVRPINTETGERGTVILQGSLQQCLS